MKDLTQGSVTRHLLHMSAFMAVSMFVQTLYLLADLFWVGSLGKEAIAAVGVAGNLNFIVLALTQMLGVGTTALISQAAGRKDQARAELVFNQSWVMSIWIALTLGIFGFLLIDGYTNSVSADARTALLAKTYLHWFLPALMLQFPLVSMGSALRATGIVQAPTLIGMISVARAAFNFWNWPVADHGRDWRRARYVYLHSRRRSVDVLVFRKEISLSPLPIFGVARANENLVGDVAHRRAGRR
jgi:Na+-driven multidrug efflux pump